jgi:hypothetical protein
MTPPRLRQNQLLLPLLRVLSEHQDGLTAAAAVDAVANALALSPAQRTLEATLPDGSTVNAFARDLRWVRQGAKLRDQIDGTIRNLWRLTPRGARDLRFATPGIVITLFETERGHALWAQAESAFALIVDSTVNLWLTSPPYDLTRQKDYGGYAGADYIAWLTDLCREMHRA